MKTITSILLGSLLFTAFSPLAWGATTTSTMHFTIQYNTNDQATVLVTEKTKTNKKTVTTKVDQFKSDSSDEFIILYTLASDYNMDVREVVRNSSFSYDRLDRKNFNSRKDSYRVAYRYFENKTIMTITINDSSFDYWMNTRNLADSSRTLASLYRVPEKKVWQSLLANKSNR